MSAPPPFCPRTHGDEPAAPSKADRRRRARARLGEAIRPRSGRGVRLTAAEVERLMGAEADRLDTDFRKRLARVPRGPRQ